MSDARIGADFERKLSLAVRMPVPRLEFVTELRERFSRQEPPSTKAARGILQRRWVWILAGVAAALLSAFLLIGPERVAALIRGIIGYIPGLGGVSDVSSAWILAEPVEVSRDGFTVRIEQAVADEGHVGIRAGLIESPATFFQGGDFGAVDLTKLRIRPSLRLLSGEVLQMYASSGPGYYDREILMQFPPMPEGTRSATLVMDILWFQHPSGDESIVMEFPLQFRPIAEDEVIPVVEIPSAGPVELPTAGEVGAPADFPAIASEKGVDFVLEKIIPLGNQTILAGSFRWTNPEGGMFLWLEGPKDMDMEKLYWKSAERNVVYVPGKYFFANPGEGLETMRLNYTMFDEITIRRAIAVLADVMKQAAQGLC